jgi:hypothetical protein
MPNLKFNYLYRDAGNYKKWGAVIFPNPDNVDFVSVSAALEAALSPETIFVASQVRIPELFLYTAGNANSDDHCFHEFHSVDLTFESQNDVHSRSIRQFIEEFAIQSKRGWIAFDPHSTSRYPMHDRPWQTA